MKFYSDRIETFEFFNKNFNNVDVYKFENKLLSGRYPSIKNAVVNFGENFLNNVGVDCYLTFSEIFVGKNVVEKTNCKIQAKKNIILLSGRNHTRVSYIGKICNGVIKYKISLTKYKLNNIPPNHVDEYVKFANWDNVSGSFSHDEFGKKHIRNVNGCYIGQYFVDENQFKLL